MSEYIHKQVVYKALKFSFFFLFILIKFNLTELHNIFVVGRVFVFLYIDNNYNYKKMKCGLRFCYYGYYCHLAFTFEFQHLILGAFLQFFFAVNWIFRSKNIYALKLKSRTHRHTRVINTYTRERREERKKPTENNNRRVRVWFNGENYNAHTTQS